MTDHHSANEFSKNLTKFTEQYQRLLQELLHKQAQEKHPVIDPFNVTGTFVEALGKLWSDPEKMLKYQMDYFEHYAELMQNVTARFLGKDEPPLYQSSSRDNRFRDIAWDENIVFNTIKQTYLMTSDWIQRMMKEVKGLSEKDEEKLTFYTRQFIDALSPTNFALTNPQVLKATLESNGENLVKGMENLLHDLEHSKRFLSIKTTDFDAFEVGKNLAVTPGKVIYQNDLMQLIQYAPSTEKNYKRPLLIIPPWINKYYILDMKEDNSFVKWLTEQGYTVFMISWVNPTRELAHKGFEDYMLEGPLAALDAIEAALGVKEVMAIGYCLGGTLLTCTLAYMKAKKDTRIVSATFLTTLIDFSDAGDLLIFVDEEQLKLVEERMSEEGYFDGSDMATTFSLLRANDMIWSFVINNYLLGKDPFPFDLLYWNSDSTRLPARMHSFYLRNMYQHNLLIKKGGITLCGVPIDVRTIDLPIYMLCTKDDHIAPWKSVYKGAKLFSREVHFVLTASGHIAGVVNHPSKKKYSFWINGKEVENPDDWFKVAEEKSGSWWEEWHAWQKAYGGDMIAAVQPGTGKSKAVEDAPGSYVKVRY